MDEPGIQEMHRSERAAYIAGQALIGSDGTESRAAKHGTLPLGYLDPSHAAVLRTEPAIGGSLTTSQAHRKDAPILRDHGSYRLAWLPD
jgi:hypothetical protein